MPGDIFISYARKDDLTTKDVVGSKGFVTALHERLLAVFQELGPPRPTLWRDLKQIDASDQFEPRLGGALREVKLLVVVLSRNWLESSWCALELDTFVKNRQAQDGADQQTRERILLVLKHNIPPDKRPSWVQGQDGYHLVQIDPENNGEIELFNSDTGRPLSQDWFDIIRRLASDLRRKIEDKENAGDQPAGGPVSLPTPEAAAPNSQVQSQNALTVYLTPPAADMAQSYATLVDELTRRSIRVVPDPGTDLPRQGSQAITMIDAALAQATLSIHLLGEKPGFQPEEAAPIVRLQLERSALKVAAVDPSAEQRFHRLIWAPRMIPGSPPSANARDPLEVLKQHAKSDPCPNDKVDGDTLTKFTEFLLQHLDNISRPRSSGPQPVPEGSQIYVEHQEQDAGVAESLAESLQSLGFAPTLPILAGAAAERERVHRDSLQNADAVVLCWADAAPAWVRATASELRRWETLGRTKAFRTRAVVALPPQIPDKERLRRFPPKTDLDALIDATDIGEVRPDRLTPRLRQLFPPAP